MQIAHQIWLDGSQVTTPTGSSAFGTGYGIYDTVAQTWTYSINVQGLDWGTLVSEYASRITATTTDDVTNAHIHTAARGANGGVGFAFLNDGDLTTLLNADGSWTLSGIWDTSEGIGAYTTAFETTAPGTDMSLYFNVHTTSFGGGEIRGQIVASADDNANAIDGTDGNETLIGLAGNDTLSGGLGDDEMRGGEDNDLYRVYSAGDVVVEAANEGSDRVISSVDFTLSDNVENLNLVGTTRSITDNNDVDGTGNALRNSIGGNFGDNRLSGLGGDDALTGQVGNDTLDGGAGADTLHGGVGDDLLIGGDDIDTVRIGVDSSSIAVAETANGLIVTSTRGVDTVMDDVEFLQFNDQTLTYAQVEARIPGPNRVYQFLLDGQQPTTPTGSTANGTGYGFFDTTTEELTYSLTVYGLDFGTMLPGFGARLTADTTDDVTNAHIHIAARGANGGVAFAFFNDDDLTATLNADGSWTMSGVWESSEGIEPFAAGFAATLPGTDMPLYFNIHTTSFGGGEIRGQIVSSADDTANTVEGTNFGNDTLLGLEGEDRLLGYGGNDSLIGGDGGDRLEGGAGDDTMIGGLGDDLYRVDSANDLIVEGADEGIDNVSTSVSFTLADNVENALVENHVDVVPLDITGNSISNTISGNYGDNRLDGLGGNDWLLAYFGNDTLLGGAGDDTLQGEEGDDSISGGADTDVAVFGVDSTEVSVALGTDALIITSSEGVDTVDNDVESFEFADQTLTYAQVEALAAPPAIDRAYQSILDGAQANAGAGTGSTAIGSSSAIFDAATGELTYNLRVSGLDFGAVLSGQASSTPDTADDVTATHIHMGARGANGGVAFNVLADDNLTAFYSSSDDTWFLSGIWDSNEDIDAYAVAFGSTTPGTDMPLYFNVHTNTVGGGEIRGQIVSSADGTANTVTGTGIGDQLQGLGGDDTLTGLAGSDFLLGGAGADDMAGGDGDDVYYVDNAGDTVTEAADEGQDQVRSTVTYTLGENVEILQISGPGQIDGTGNALSNTLIGNSDANRLEGLGGNDVLRGLGGADTLIGGLGDDVYYVDDLDSTITEAADEGNDRVLATMSYTLAANLEVLGLNGSGDLDGTGNASDNFIGGTSGANVLSGLSGNDALRGYSGDDTLNGGTGNDEMRGGDDTDTAIFSVASTDVVVTAGADYLVLISTDGLDVVYDDVEQFEFNDGTFSFAQVAALEIAVPTSGDDVLDGTDQNDTVDGLDGNDTIRGLVGDDSLLGGNGEDRLEGGVGRDTLLGNADNDTLFGGGGYDQLFGQFGDDSLNGGDGDDRMDGGRGADTMAGGQNGDFYFVNDPGDIVIEIAGHIGIDRVASSVSFDMGTQHIETLILGGPNNIDGTGNDLNNFILGNGGNNVARGEGGNDRIETGAGEDTLYGGTGNDTMNGGPGSDTFFVADAGDRVAESRRWEGVDLVISSVDFRMGTAHIENLELTGTARIGAGNGLMNRIQGNDGDNILDGGKNVDTLVGGLGDDTYLIRAPGDSIVEIAGEGIDAVRAFRSYALDANVEKLFMQNVFTRDGDPTNLNGIGNELNNTIVGTPFANTIVGREGNDILKGQAGDDTFVFDRTLGSNNIDRIIDFQTIGGDDDTLKIKASILGGGVTAGVLDAADFVAGTAAVDASDRFIFDQASGELYFDVDGVGGAAQQLIATFEQNALVAAADIEVF